MLRWKALPPSAARSSTGVGAVLNTAKRHAGKSVAVFGCGGVGLNVVQGANLRRRLADHRRRHVEEKLALAKQFGATHLVNADEGASRPQGPRDHRRRRGLRLRGRRRRGSARAGVRFARTAAAWRSWSACRRSARSTASTRSTCSTTRRSTAAPTAQRTFRQRLPDDRQPLHGEEAQARRADHADVPAGSDQRGLRAR